MGASHSLWSTPLTALETIHWKWQTFVLPVMLLLLLMMLLGNNFYTWAPLEPMYGLKEFKSKTLYFCF